MVMHRLGWSQIVGITSRILMLSLTLAFAAPEPGSCVAASTSGILSVTDPVGALPSIRFSLPEAGDLQVRVWNTLGQRVTTFSASHLVAGVYAVSWDGLDQQGRSVSAGIYFIQVDAHGRSYSHKTVVFRGARGVTRISYAGPVVEPASAVQEQVSGPLRSYLGQPMTREDWGALASPLRYLPGVRHRAFGRGLAQVHAGTMTRRQLERAVGGAIAGQSGGRLRGLAKPVLLEQDGTLYQVHEAQYLARFRGINLLGDAEQDGDVDSDDLFRAADALENQEPYYDLNRNGVVDLWDLFAVVDHMGLRRDGPFLLLNEGGFRLCEAAVSASASGDLPRIEYFNPADSSVTTVLESLICGDCDQALEVQRPGIEPFVVVRSALLNDMRFISPLNFWSGVSDSAGTQISTRTVQEVHRLDSDAELLEGLNYVAFGYRLPQVDENGDLVAETYEYSQVLVFGWHFSEVFDGLPKLDTFPVDPNVDVGYEPPGPAAISQLAATKADQAGRFLVAVNANRIDFGMTFFVSKTSLALEELVKKGIAVPILGESGSGFARQYEVEIPAGEWLLYGGLILNGGNLAGLAVSQISSTGPVSTIEQISFEDAHLETAVRGAIAKPEGALFPADVAALGMLVAPAVGIVNLAGIEHLTGLRRLDLRRNGIVALGSLPALLQLQELHLGNNQISSLAPLATLSQLDALGLENNRIEELTALVENSGLGRGDTIDLRGNPLAASAIDNDLCALERRRVSVLSNVLPCVDIENLEALGLEKPLVFADFNLELAVREGIGKTRGNLFGSDVRGLRVLDASGRGVVDLGGIERVADLQAIDLRSNRIAVLEPLSGLPELREIQLNDNEVVDLSPLLDMFQLQILKLQRNRIRDLSALVANSGIQEGDAVDLCVNPLGGSTAAQVNLLRTRLVAVDTTVVFVDLNPLSSGENIRALFLDRNQVAELGPLQGLQRLTRLSLAHNRISSLVPLAGSENLMSLTVSNNQLSDLAPLASLANLSTLAADGNQIEDLSPLAALHNLRGLSVRDNQIADLSPLESLITLPRPKSDHQSVSAVAAGEFRDPFLGYQFHQRYPPIGRANLSSLSLSTNRLSNLEPLTELFGLKTLLLDANQIGDLVL